jgi:hypothetical protein
MASLKHTIVLVATMLAAGATDRPAAADDVDSAMVAARAAGSVEIVVLERYEATSRYLGTTPQQNLSYAAQPFADLAERLFALANIATNDGTVGYRLLIDAYGVAEAALYDSSVNGQRIREATYRSASLSGTITVQTASGTQTRRFDGYVPSPFPFMKTFGYDPFRNPDNAPFREAFEAPGGYAQTIARLIGDYYGEGVLRIALDDNDPLVRRAAEMALGN